MYVCVHRSLAKLGYRPPHSILQQLSEGSCRLMRQASAQDMSLTCYSFGVLGYKPPEAWWTGFWASSGAKMQAASSQGLANTFWALGRLKKGRPGGGGGGAVSVVCAVLKTAVVVVLYSLQATISRTFVQYHPYHSLQS